MRQRRHLALQVVAEGVEHTRADAGEDRRHLELVAHRTGGAVLPLEVVGRGGLRRAVEGVDALFELRQRQHHRMDEAALADDVVRVGHLRAQQQRRRVDGTAGGDVVLRLDGQLHTAGRAAVCAQGLADRAADLAVGMLQLAHAHAVHQRRAVLQRFGDGRHQHRLLGIDRAAEAAVAGVPATTHVARDRMCLPAQRLAAAHQHAVVRVLRLPQGDVQALFHLLEPRLHLVDAVADHLALRGPELQRRLGRAEARGPVDRGGTAHRAALQHGDGAIGGRARATFLVQLAHRAAFVHVAKAVRGAQCTLFQQQHFEAGQRQDLGGHAAAGAAADDGHVGFQGLRRAQLGAVDDLPARSDALGVDVG